MRKGEFLPVVAAEFALRVPGPLFARGHAADLLLELLAVRAPGTEHGFEFGLVQRTDGLLDDAGDLRLRLQPLERAVDDLAPDQGRESRLRRRSLGREVPGGERAVLVPTLPFFRILVEEHQFGRRPGPAQRRIGEGVDQGRRLGDLVPVQPLQRRGPARLRGDRHVPAAPHFRSTAGEPPVVPFGSPRRAHDDQAVASPRRRHVQKARFLRRGLEFLAAQDPVAAHPPVGRLEAEERAEFGIGPVLVRTRGPEPPVDTDQKDDRPLQALCLMDRRQRDDIVFLRIERRLREPDVAARRAIPDFEEGGQVVRAMRFGEVDETLQVREDLLRALHEQRVQPVSRASEQLLDDLVEGEPGSEPAQVVEHREPVLQRASLDLGQPRVVGGRGPLPFLQPSLRLPDERPAALEQTHAGDRLVAQPHEGRPQVAEGADVVPLVPEQPERVEDIEDLLAFPEVRHAGDEVGDAVALERRLEVFEPAAGTVEESDVAEGERTQLAGVGIADFVAAHRCEDPGRDARGLGFATLGGLLSLRREPLHSRLRVVGHAGHQVRVFDPARELFLGEGGSRFVHRDAADNVDEVDDRGGAAEVPREIEDVALLRKIGGNVVPHRDVGAAEAVDALLRIADEEELRTLYAASDGEGDVALREIGVLELIDDEHPVAIPDRGERRVAFGAEQEVGRPEHEAVEVALVLLLQPSVPAHAGFERQFGEFRTDREGFFVLRLAFCAQRPHRGQIEAGAFGRKQVERPVFRRRRIGPEPSRVSPLPPAQVPDDVPDVVDRTLDVLPARELPATQDRLRGDILLRKLLEQERLDEFVLLGPRLVFIEDLEGRIDPQAQGVLPEQVAAEGVNRADRGPVDLPAQFVRAR